MKSRIAFTLVEDAEDSESGCHVFECVRWIDDSHARTAALRSAIQGEGLVDEWEDALAKESDAVYTWETLENGMTVTRALVQA